MMATEPDAPNTLQPNGRKPQGQAGEIPETVRRRYYLDSRGGPGLGFYVDARITSPAFRDHGLRLATTRNDPNAIRDMTLIARHRGWTLVTVRGAHSFRREAWLAGRALGIEVRGYRPTERDVQDLDRRLAARNRAKADREPPPGPPPPDRSADNHVKPQSTRTQIRVAEAVIRARVRDPDAQDRMLQRARRRIADWLERGARFEPLFFPEKQPTHETHFRKERRR